MSDMREKLGGFLAQKRQKANLSQRAVSEALGYSSPQFISNMERGLCEPPVQILKKLAKLYGISAPDLLDRVIDSVTHRIRSEFKRSTANSAPPRAGVR